VSYTPQELSAWLDAKCERIATPPKPDSWRSRYGVFSDAAATLTGTQATPERTPIVAGTDDEKLIALNALCYCAWSEGVSTKHVNDIYRRTRVNIPSRAKESIENVREQA
jgi:hypothetical protein